MTERRHLLIAGGIWLVLSVVGVYLVSGIQILPVIASNEALIENDAFVVLAMASVPVLLFVVVGLVYSALRFRARGDMADGPPVHGHAGFQRIWLGLSTALVIFLFAYGAVGLANIRGAQSADYTVSIRAEQWAWHYDYPASGVTSAELHIPVGRRVHLALQSIDVIHSFWVPALGVKQDVVPGRTTDIYLTATSVGTFPAMCAELCGLGHTTMTTTVVISDQAALDVWLASTPSPKP